MRNKSIINFLLVLLVVIWGTVIWKVCKKMEPINNVKKDNITVSISEKQRYELMLNYRDPFLGEDNSKISMSINTDKKGKSQVPEDVPINVTLKYRGVIKKGKKEYAIIDNGANREIFFQGETIDGFLVSKITNDSIVLRKSLRNYILKTE